MLQNITSDDGPFGPSPNGTLIIVFYEYRPILPAGYAFVALFGIATLGHLVYLFWLRAWSFIPFILGGIAEVFGYYGRVRSHDQPDAVGPWIQQNLLILVAAPFVAATVYMSLGRIVYAMDAREHAFISPRWVTRLYVLIDIACLGTQLAGTVMPASGDLHLIELSREIILGGLIAQIVALGIFFILCTSIHRSLSRKGPRTMVLEGSRINWQFHFRAIELVMILIMIRSLVRAIEYGQGDTGFVASHEIFIYLFDAAPMFLVMTIFLVIHPIRLQRDAKAFYEEEGTIAMRNWS